MLWYVQCTKNTDDADPKSDSPPIVLGIQQEVGADNGDTHSDNSKDDEDEKHESVDVVDLVRPERREYEVPAVDKENANVSIGDIMPVSTVSIIYPFYPVNKLK